MLLNQSTFSLQQTIRKRIFWLKRTERTALQASFDNELITKTSTYLVLPCKQTMCDKYVKQHLMGFFITTHEEDIDLCWSITSNWSVYLTHFLKKKHSAGWVQRCHNAHHLHLHRSCALKFHTKARKNEWSTWQIFRPNIECITKTYQLVSAWKLFPYVVMLLLVMPVCPKALLLDTYYVKSIKT